MSEENKLIQAYCWVSILVFLGLSFLNSSHLAKFIDNGLVPAIIIGIILAPFLFLEKWRSG